MKYGINLVDENNNKTNLWITKSGKFGKLEKAKIWKTANGPKTELQHLQQIALTSGPFNSPVSLNLQITKIEK